MTLALLTGDKGRQNGMSPRRPDGANSMTARAVYRDPVSKKISKKRKSKVDIILRIYSLGELESEQGRSEGRCSNREHINGCQSLRRRKVEVRVVDDGQGAGCNWDDGKISNAL